MCDFQPENHTLIGNFQGGIMDNSFGPRLSELLKKRGIKQVELSSDTGLSKNTINYYISGKNFPDTESLYKISKVLNVSMEWLLTGTENFQVESHDTVSPANAQSSYSHDATASSNTDDIQHRVISDPTPLQPFEMEVINQLRTLPKDDVWTVLQMIGILHDRAKQTEEFKARLAQYDNSNGNTTN